MFLEEFINGVAKNRWQRYIFFISLSYIYFSILSVFSCYDIFFVNSLIFWTVWDGLSNGWCIWFEQIEHRSNQRSFWRYYKKLCNIFDFQPCICFKPYLILSSKSLFKFLLGAPRPYDTTMSCDRVHQVLKKDDSNEGEQNQV